MKPPKNKPKRRGARGNPHIAEYGVATQFPPGRSPNPGGRPRRTPYMDAHRQVAELTVRELRISQTDSVAFATAKSVARQALKGRISAAAEAANRAEGTPCQGLRVEGADGGALQIEDQNIDELRRSVTELLQKIRARSSTDPR